MLAWPSSDDTVLMSVPELSRFTAKLWRLQCHVMRFFYSRQTYPSGEMLSCSAAVGQNEDTLFRIVALFGMADKPQQFIVQWYDNGGMCAPPRAFLLIESHYHAFIIHIGERQSRHIAIAQSCEAAEYKCPLHFAMLPL